MAELVCPSLANSHVSIPTTGLPILRARAISDNVPKSPPTASTASAVRVMIAFRASPSPGGDRHLHVRVRRVAAVRRKYPDRQTALQARASARGLHDAA